VGGGQPKHGSMLLRALDFSYAGVWNMLLFPASVVPLGLSSAGVPLGIQVIGARGQDHLTLAVAMELERAFGGWRAPPLRPLRA
jgi:fatty acid amide hydrolase 2